MNSYTGIWDVLIITLVRLFSIFGSLCLSMILMAEFDDYGFGVVTFVMTTGVWFSVLSRFGMDRTLLRLISGSSDKAYVAYSVSKIMQLWVLIQLPFILICSLWFYLWDGGAEFLQNIGIIGLICLSCCISLTFVFSDFLRSRGEVSVALCFSGVFVPLFMATYIYIVELLNAVEFFELYLWVVALNLVCIIVYVFFKYRSMLIGSVVLGVPPSEMFNSIKVGFNIFVHTGVTIGAIALPIFLIGMMLGPPEVAIYQKYFLLSMIVGSAALIINAVYEPKMAAAMNNKKSLLVEKIMKDLGWISLFLVFSALLVTAVILNVIDGYFEFEFEFDLYMVLIICCAQTLNVFSSKFQCFFMMYQDARVVTKASVTVFVVLFVSLLIMVPLYGVLGAVLSLFFSFLTKFMLYFAIYKGRVCG